jgi:hypothetical protein
LPDEFVQLVTGLASVRAIRVSSTVTTRPDTESVYFDVPASPAGEHRLLQVFFAHGTSPTPEEFVRMRHELAVLASGLPDVDMLLPLDPADSSAELLAERL